MYGRDRDSIIDVLTCSVSPGWTRPGGPGQNPLDLSVTQVSNPSHSARGRPRRPTVTGRLLSGWCYSSVAEGSLQCRPGRASAANITVTVLLPVRLAGHWQDWISWYSSEDSENRVSSWVHSWVTITVQGAEVNGLWDLEYICKSSSSNIDHRVEQCMQHCEVNIWDCQHC